METEEEEMPFERKLRKWNETDEQHYKMSTTYHGYQSVAAPILLNFSPLLPLSLSLPLLRFIGFEEVCHNKAMQDEW